MSEIERAIEKKEYIERGAAIKTLIAAIHNDGYQGESNIERHELREDEIEDAILSIPAADVAEISHDPNDAFRLDGLRVLTPDADTWFADVRRILYDASGNEIISLSRLRELAEAERGKRVLIVPPVKRGDKVWILRMLRGGHIKPVLGHVGNLVLSFDHKILVSVYGVGRGEWGKRVFLTEAEAERALAEEGDAT